MRLRRRSGYFKGTVEEVGEVSLDKDRDRLCRAGGCRPPAGGQRHRGGGIKLHKQDVVDREGARQPRREVGGERVHAGRADADRG